MSAATVAALPLAVSPMPHHGEVVVLPEGRAYVVGGERTYSSGRSRIATADLLARVDVLLEGDGPGPDRTRRLSPEEFLAAREAARRPEREPLAAWLAAREGQGPRVAAEPVRRPARPRPPRLHASRGKTLAVGSIVRLRPGTPVSSSVIVVEDAQAGYVVIGIGTRPKEVHAQGLATGALLTFRRDGVDVVGAWTGEEAQP